MIYWILLFVSIVSLVLIFLRRMRLTYFDLRFQKNLEEEELIQAEEQEIPEPEVEEKAPAPKGSVRQLFMKGDTHFSRSQYDKAEPLLLAVIDLDEGHLDAHHKLGLMYLKLEDFAKAELFFSKLVNLKKDPVYFSNLGAALYQQQRLVEAAEAYENAIAMDDKRANRLQSLAQVYYELGDDEKAIEYFERTAHKKPKDNDLKMLLADYYDRLDRNEDSVAILNKILENDPYHKEAKAKLKKL